MPGSLLGLQCTLQTFWSLLVGVLFFGSSAYLQAPASIGCNDWQVGWPILFRGPARETALARTTQLKNRVGLGNVTVDGPGRSKLSPQNNKIPGSGRSTRGYILTPLQVLRGRTLILSALGFSTEKTLISASAVLQCGGGKQAQRSD